jgi:hypothetical protein
MQYWKFQNISGRNYWIESKRRFPFGEVNQRPIQLRPSTPKYITITHIYIYVYILQTNDGSVLDLFSFALRENGTFILGSDSCSRVRVVAEIWKIRWWFFKDIPRIGCVVYNPFNIHIYPINIWVLYGIIMG